MRTVQRSLEVGDVDSITTVAGGACTGAETGTGTGAGAGAHTGAAGGAARSMRDPSPMRRPCGGAWGAAAVAAVAVGVAAAECGDGCVVSCCLQAWGLTRKVLSVVSWQPCGGTTRSTQEAVKSGASNLGETAGPFYGHLSCTALQPLWTQQQQLIDHVCSEVTIHLKASAML